MSWSPEQEAALRAVGQWLDAADRPIFRLFGYAGTGKTTLARHIAQHVDGDVCFAAFTGKAALVLREKGCPDASTIHSLIYRSRGTGETGPQFVLNRQSAAASAQLIVIDECSMVDEDLGRDLLGFGTPVLVLGDPAQLPPVKGAGYFTEHPPDAMLTEIHRQAKDDPIIALSALVREGGRLARGRYGESEVVSRREIDAERILGADQVLVGMNKSRRAYTSRIRQLLGYRDPMPAAGETLVCLRNDKTKGLLNGGIFTIRKLGGEEEGRLAMDVAQEGERGAVRVSVPREFFEGREEELPYAVRRKGDEFDYGYVLTVHKAQGSQWDDLVLFDESWAFREHRARWLYTGLTRAAKKLTVVQ
ncbi:ATP-dependent RecD-like DNA helicase [Enterovirga sp.]|uniref:ATP-dependent DNA helicase n=1 Tax=Enterovirga sp. TaxID=2026350 RepID=UPI002CE53236|nr:ATP-dependent RecD-like DNA helicase [Enterovirga sp.]HMO29573.1 ATP-dependent RecD-like DNA helicase [Enterovirga sp.]